MASITTRSGRLVIDFRYKNQRCREKTSLIDTPQNRKQLMLLVKRIEAEITLGTFEYKKYFPESKRAEKLSLMEKQSITKCLETPLFETFCEIWFSEKKPEWRKSHQKNVRAILDRYLLPQFAKEEIGNIKKSSILNYRSTLVGSLNGRGKVLSGERINKILMPLRMIINEAADRYDFVTPWQNIKPLKIKKSSVEPFTLDEVLFFLEKVRADFKIYYTVRFFTGLRTSEINGLTWENIDFERRQLLIHHALVDGEIVETKTDGSFRAVDMSQQVYEVLKQQEKVTKHLSQFVFCNQYGDPLNYRNITRRVWHPTLKYLGLKPRRAYETRHTAATLWLAAGESPEWIARQMGHANTNMLFKVYSRYVPNLTRKDGAVFEKLINTKIEKLNEKTAVASVLRKEDR